MSKSVSNVRHVPLPSERSEVPVIVEGTLLMILTQSYIFETLAFPNIPTCVNEAAVSVCSW